MSRTRTLTSRSHRQHVVEAAVADVVGPAVAAHDPDALLDEIVGYLPRGAAASGPSTWMPRRASAQVATRSTLLPSIPASWTGRPRGALRARSSPIPFRRGGHGGSFGLLPRACRRPAGIPRSELRVVLEERVGPGRAAAVAVGGVGAWSAGCRRRSTSSRWRWRSSRRSP